VTLTNNATAGPLKYTWFGRVSSLGGQNTLDGFRYIYGSGARAAKLTVDGTDYTLTTRTGYEFYKMPGGKIGLRKAP
jgi:hypothetical protein